jgi:hypothetical protein
MEDSKYHRYPKSVKPGVGNSNEKHKKHDNGTRIRVATNRADRHNLSRRQYSLAQIHRITGDDFLPLPRAHKISASSPRQSSGPELSKSQTLCPLMVSKD